MPIYELQNLDGKVIYRQKVEYVPIVRWKRETEKKVLTQARKEKYWTDIRRGSVVVAWADYDTCNPTEDDVQVVFRRSATACILSLVQRGSKYGIIAREGSQETVVAGEIMRYERCKVVEKLHYTERDVIFGKSLKQVEAWTEKYFKE